MPAPCTIHSFDVEGAAAYTVTTNERNNYVEATTHYCIQLLLISRGPNTTMKYQESHLTDH